MNVLDARVGADGTVRLGEAEIACGNWRLEPRLDQPVRLAVRPEDVQLQVGTAEEPNTVTGQVVWVEFLGSTYRLDLALDGEEDRKLKTELSANMMREMNLSEGMCVSVVLPAELLWVYEA